MHIETTPDSVLAEGSWNKYLTSLIVAALITLLGIGMEVYALYYFGIYLPSSTFKFGPAFFVALIAAAGYWFIRDTTKKASETARIRIVAHLNPLEVTLTNERAWGKETQKISVEKLEAVQIIQHPYGRGGYWYEVELNLKDKERRVIFNTQTDNSVSIIPTKAEEEIKSLATALARLYDVPCRENTNPKVLDQLLTGRTKTNETINTN